MTGTAGLGWMDDAACAGSGDLFFSRDPEPDADLIAFTTAEKARVRTAEGICRCCPVTDDCLRYAQALGVREGIWGGMDRSLRLCGNGRHVMTPANTQARSDGTKCCRACRLATDRRYRQRRQGEEVAA